MSDIEALAAALVAALDPASEIQLRRVLGGQAYRQGHRDGWREGYAEAQREMAAAWHRIADPVARGGPAHAELEARRWGPGGRERFGDPRPGDHLPAEAARTRGAA